MQISKPFLLLQLRPEDETSDSEFEAIVEYSGLMPEDFHRIRIEKTGFSSFNLDDYSAVIVGGSPFDITTPENEKSYLQQKIEADFSSFFDQVVPNDFPFLGACSGNGLLGSYLGAQLSSKYAEPVGGVTLSITEQGMADPLLTGFPQQIRVLLGHKEACDEVPEGATLLVRGDACPVQMFRVGLNVYATQFHPEGDCKGFAVRIHAYKHHGYFPSEEADRLIKKLQHEHTPYAQEILKRFVMRYAV
ncbi:MAG: glutamine amidotransferase [Arenicellales bacterium]